MRFLITMLCAALVIGCATKQKEATADPKTGKPAWTSVYDPTGRTGSGGRSTLEGNIRNVWRGFTKSVCGLFTPKS
jgi:hypothetical protein